MKCKQTRKTFTFPNFCLYFPQSNSSITIDYNMPRVAQAPRANTSRVASGSIATSPFKSPVKCASSGPLQKSLLLTMGRIPLNDDAQEKAKRLEKRHALHDIQINQIKAAASPMRKLTSFERA